MKLTRALTQFRHIGELPDSYEMILALAWTSDKKSAGTATVQLEKMRGPL